MAQTVTAAADSKRRLSSLSPLTVVIAAGFTYRVVKLPGLVAQIEALEASYGITASGMEAWIGSDAATICLWAFIGLVVGKDWYFKTERARVWANLASIPIGALTYLPLSLRMQEVFSAQ